MSPSRLEKIRKAVRSDRFDMTAHAVEEMAEDSLTIHDIESAVGNGVLARTEKDDPRGTRYVIEGYAADGQTPMGVVGRFVDENRFLIITVYEISDRI